MALVVRARKTRKDTLRWFEDLGTEVREDSDSSGLDRSGQGISFESQIVNTVGFASFIWYYPAFLCDPLNTSEAHSQLMGRTKICCRLDP